MRNGRAMQPLNRRLTIRRSQGRGVLDSDMEGLALRWILANDLPE